MPPGRSLLPVFGIWVVWVHLVSLLVIQPLGGTGNAPAPLRPSVRFVDADTVHVCDPGIGVNGLRGVEAELSEPCDHPLDVPVTAIPASIPPPGIEPARPGVDYAADRDAVFHFPAGSRRGSLRERDSLLDITVAGDPGSGGVGLRASAARRFRLRLEHTGAVVVAADPQGFRTVEIPGNGPVSTRGIPAHFRDLLVDLDERDLADHQFVVEAARPPAEDAELRFALHRISGQGQVSLEQFTARMPAGSREVRFSLRDLLAPADLARIGVTYDPRPGVDSWYELHLDARPPLISAEDPCLAKIFCRDRDAPADIAYRIEDESGRELRRIIPDAPFFVVAELSHPLENDCSVTPRIDGQPLVPGGVIPAGLTRGDRLGPYRLAVNPGDDSEEVVVGLIPRPERGGPGGRCGKCGGRPGGCAACGNGSGVCNRCGGKGGACEVCGGGSGGRCGKCGGRPGGCAACGNGSGVCNRCGGKGGACEVCGGGSGGRCGKCGGRPGGCAACGGGGSGGGGSGGGGSGGGGSGGGGSGGGGSGGGGSGGGGSGGGGGPGNGQSPVVPPPETSLAKGPPVPGDFMIFLVNNQRLHEPNDAITARVREAIRDRNPYRQGAIVLNRDGRETLLTEHSEPPAVDRAFEPFSQQREDLTGQTRRIVDTIARKRRSAENPEIRTLVVWPEREFVSASTLDVFSELVNDGRGPVSFLCPDADPERARELAAALFSAAGDRGGVTVRSPKSEELVEHIDDVLDAIAASPTDRLNIEGDRR